MAEMIKWEEMLKEMAFKDLGVPKEVMGMTSEEKGKLIADKIFTEMMEQPADTCTVTCTKSRETTELADAIEFKPFPVRCIDNPDEMAKHFEKGIEYMCMGVDTINNKLLVVDMNGVEVLVNTGWFMKVIRKTVNAPDLQKIRFQQEYLGKFVEMTDGESVKIRIIDPPNEMINPYTHYTKTELDQMIAAGETAKKLEDVRKEKEKVEADLYLRKYRELKMKHDPNPLSALAEEFTESMEEQERRLQKAEQLKEYKAKRQHEYEIAKMKHEQEQMARRYEEDRMRREHERSHDERREYELEEVNRNIARMREHIKDLNHDPDVDPRELQRYHNEMEILYKMKGELTRWDGRTVRHMEQ